jgi:hypothetical protein
MKKTSLFVGGSKDGERMEVPSDQYIIKVAKLKEREPMFDVPLSGFESFIETEIYEQKLFRDEDGEYQAWFVQGTKSPMGMLLQGYRKQPKETATSGAA